LGDEGPALSRLIIDARAEEEAAAAFEWYETQSLGLGQEFLRALDAVFASVQRRPQLSAVVRGRVRRGLMRRFPYGVFFIERPDAVVILAVVHAHRHPRLWPSRPAD
jgi:plasmid stabilization system protein ParE